MTSSGEMFGKSQGCVVLDGGGDQVLVGGTSVDRAAHGEVNRLGSAGGEHNAIGADAKQIGNLLAGEFDGVCGLLAHLMKAGRVAEASRKKGLPSRYSSLLSSGAKDKIAAFSVALKTDDIF